MKARCFNCVFWDCFEDGYGKCMPLTEQQDNILLVNNELNKLVKPNFVVTKQTFGCVFFEDKKTLN